MSDCDSFGEFVDYKQLLISPAEENKLRFEENMQLVDSEGQLIDIVTVAVEKSDLAKDAFIVYQYSQGKEHFLRVQSHVYFTLDTESEVRKIQKPDKKKLLRITDFGSKFKVFKLTIEGNYGTREKHDITKSSNGRYFLEGSNTVLLRKIALSGLLGYFRGQTINHEGELCVCEYMIESGEHDEVKVRRTVGEEVMTTLLSRDGRIIMHKWSTSEWCLVSNLQQLRSGTMFGEEEDSDYPGPELKADKTAYFDKKDALIQMMRLYLQDHCDVQDMVADFLKKVLFDKPDDVIDFADRYFCEFMNIAHDSEVSEPIMNHTL